MDLETFKNAGIRFDHSEHAVVPEIPRVQDVLFALRLVERQEDYEFCVNNHSPYVANVGLVIAATSDDVLNMRRYDEGEARKIIARAIVDLCPEEARCLFSSAYIEALKTAGQIVPELTSREQIIAACSCRKCRARHEAA